MAYIQKITPLGAPATYDVKDIYALRINSDIPLIASNTNLNDAPMGQVAYVQNIAAAQTITNYPNQATATSGGRVITIAGYPTDYAHQFVLSSTIGRCFHRVQEGSTWQTTWYRLVHAPSAETAVGSASLPIYINASGITTAVNANSTANALINSLTVGTTTPVDADYYISQYVDGGTTTTTYHRRPHSVLWNYIKSKITAATDLGYVKKAGDTMTGQLYLNYEQDVGLNQNGSLIIGNKAGSNIAIDSNEIMARNNSAASTLYLNTEGGDIVTSGMYPYATGKILGGTGAAHHYYRLYLGGATADSKALNSGNPFIEFCNSDRSQYGQIIYTDFNNQGGSDSFSFRSNQSDLRVYAPKLHGAVWNDYAEFRQSEITEPGKCIKETGNGDLILSEQRLEKGCEIISDTYGFAIGESNTCKTPTAASGRVLAFPYEDKEIFRQHIGDPVCSGPNGTVSIMTSEEERNYPSRIIGTISEIPDYDIWYAGDDGKLEIKVNGRIWIRIR